MLKPVRVRLDELHTQVARQAHRQAVLRRYVTVQIFGIRPTPKHPAAHWTCTPATSPWAYACSRGFVSSVAVPGRVRTQNNIKERDGKTAASLGREGGGRSADQTKWSYSTERRTARLV